MNFAVAEREPAPVATAENQNLYTYRPRADVWETSQAYWLELELPGVSSENVDLKVEEGTLAVLGRVQPQSYPGYTRLAAEYEVGNYERSFRLAEDIDAERIKAEMKNGVLRVELPKREAVQPKRIQIKAA